MKRKMKKWLGLVLVGCVATASAQNTFPLKLDVDVSTKRSRRNIGAGRQGEAKVEQVQLRVKIRRSSGESYSDKLTAELYVIGRQIHTGYYGIIDVVKKDFYLTQENDNTFEFVSPMYSLGRTSGNVNVGGEYETFLVVVVDKDGKIIATRSGRVIREEGIDIIRQWSKNTLFDRDGNVVGHVEEPGRAFRRAVPAAVSGHGW